MRAYRNNGPVPVRKLFSCYEDYESFKTVDDRVKEKTINTYFSKDIQKKAGVSASELRHWTVTGVIVPHAPVQGTGRMHLYDHQNLIEAMICRELNKYFIPFHLMKEVIFYLRKKLWTVVFYPKFINGDVPTLDSISKDLSLWDYLKIADHDANIRLFLCRDTSCLAGQATADKNDFSVDVTFGDLVSCAPCFASMVIINVSILNDDAGCFLRDEQCDLVDVVVKLEPLAVIKG